MANGSFYLIGTLFAVNSTIADGCLTKRREMDAPAFSFSKNTCFAVDKGEKVGYNSYAEENLLSWWCFIATEIV
ncbi:MAG: hypothetical protein ACI3XE_06055 [Eubacteriales bacterium]